MIFLPVVSIGKSLILEGESYSIDQDKQRYTYINFQVTIGQTKISGNQLVYDLKSKTLQFTGNIIIREPGFLLTGERGLYDLKTSEITLEKATLYDAKSGSYASAASIRKVSKNKFIIQDGTITLCKPEEPAWELQASEIVYEIDSFAYAYNSTIYHHSVPIWYTPFISWPTKKGRASGFLSPSFETQLGNSDRSKNYGYRFGIPYFLDFDQEHDLTVTADVMSLRGVGADFDYNYAFREGMRGRFNLWYLDETVQDRDLANENLGNKTSDDIDLQPNRFKYFFNHRQNIFWGGQLFLNQSGYSDNEVNEEYFNSGVRNDPFYSYEVSLPFPLKDGSLIVRATKGANFNQSSIYDKRTDVDTHLNIQPGIVSTYRFGNLLGTPISLSLAGSGTNYQRTNGWEGKYLTGTTDFSTVFHVDFLNILPSYKRTYYQFDVNYNRAFSETGNSGFDETPETFGWSIDTQRLEFNFETFRLFQNQEQKLVGKLLFRPRLIFEEVQDVDQRRALATTPSNFALSGTNSDYTSFSPMLGTSVIGRKSITLRWETEYLTKDINTEEVRKYFQLNLIQIFNLLRENKSRTFEGPENQNQETEAGNTRLPLRVELILTPANQFSANLFYRYDHEENKIIENRFGINVSPTTNESFAVKYINNTKQYHELNGTNRAASKSVTISNLLQLSRQFELSLSGTWDLGRQDLATQYSASNDVKRLERQLTSMNGNLTYLEDCYKYVVSYEEGIKIKTVNGAKQEFIDRKITLTFNLVGWPDSASPYQLGTPYQLNTNY